MAEGRRIAAVDSIGSWEAHQLLVMDALQRIDKALERQDGQMDSLRDKIDTMREEDRKALEASKERIIELEKSNAVAKGKIAVIAGLGGILIGLLHEVIAKVLQ